MLQSRVLTSAWVIRFPPLSMSAGPSQTFVCIQCGMAFTRRNLKRHQGAQLPLSGFLRCSLCRKVFSWDHRSDLFRHCRQVHQLSAMEAPSYKDISPSFLQDEPPVIPNERIDSAGGPGFGRGAAAAAATGAAGAGAAATAPTATTVTNNAQPCPHSEGCPGHIGSPVSAVSDADWYRSGRFRQHLWLPWPERCHAPGSPRHARVPVCSHQCGSPRGWSRGRAIVHRLRMRKLCDIPTFWLL